MKNKSDKTSQNLLELTPKQLVEYTNSDDGIVTLSLPKFRTKIAKVIFSKMKNKTYTLKLDAIGSFVWNECDGEKNVHDISQNMLEEFGEEIEPVYERISLFLKTLTNVKAIELG